METKTCESSVADLAARPAHRESATMTQREMDDSSGASLEQIRVEAVRTGRRESVMSELHQAAAEHLPLDLPARQDFVFEQHVPHEVAVFVLGVSPASR